MYIVYSDIYIFAKILNTKIRNYTSWHIGYKIDCLYSSSILKIKFCGLWLTDKVPAMYTLKHVDCEGKH